MGLVHEGQVVYKEWQLLRWGTSGWIYVFTNTELSNTNSRHQNPKWHELLLFSAEDFSEAEELIK